MKNNINNAEYSGKKQLLAQRTFKWTFEQIVIFVG